MTAPRRIVGFSAHPYRCQNPQCVRGDKGQAKSLPRGAVWFHALTFSSIECRGCGTRWLLRIPSLRMSRMPVLLVQVTRREFERLRERADRGGVLDDAGLEREVRAHYVSGRYARAAEAFAQWTETVLAGLGD